MPSEWLEVMLEEVLRKREEAELARREQVLRQSERPGDVAAGKSPRRASRRTATAT